MPPGTCGVQPLMDELSAAIVRRYKVHGRSSILVPVPFIGFTHAILNQYMTAARPLRAEGLVFLFELDNRIGLKIEDRRPLRAIPAIQRAGNFFQLPGLKDRILVVPYVHL